MSNSIELNSIEQSQEQSRPLPAVSNVVINGEARQIPGLHTVATLLQLLAVPSDRVAIELNKAIVRKRDWASTPVESGSQVEIVEFVGGG